MDVVACSLDEAASAPQEAIMRLAVPAIAMLVLAACAPQPPQGAQSVTYSAGPTVDPARLANHVRVLAADDFLGRGPATPGEEKTVAYVAEQFRAAGLQP